MKVKLIFLIIVSLLTGCVGITNEQSDNSVLSLTERPRKIEITIAPTQTPIPTATPTPTPTPAPDKLVDFIPTESYFTYKGSGENKVHLKHPHGVSPSTFLLELLDT